MISIEREDRPWGRYFILHDEPNYKLKRIEIDPAKDYLINIIIRDLNAGQ